MSFNSFLQKQNDIYSDIKSQGNQLLKDGITPNFNLLKGEKGYIIAYKHGDEINKKIEKISQKITKLVPAMVYKSKDVHTTIYAQKIEFKKEFDDSYLDLLKSILNKLTFYITKIDYKDLLYNQDSVIGAGQPDRSFYKNCQEIIYSLNKKDINATFPKMAHITLSRFIDESDKENIDRLVEYLKNVGEIGLSKPEKIILGTFITTVKGFELNIHEKYNLMSI